MFKGAVGASGPRRPTAPPPRGPGALCRVPGPPHLFVCHAGKVCRGAKKNRRRNVKAPGAGLQGAGVGAVPLRPGWDHRDAPVHSGAGGGGDGRARYLRAEMSLNRQLIAFTKKNPQNQKPTFFFFKSTNSHKRVCIFFFVANDSDLLMEEGMAFTIGQ